MSAAAGTRRRLVPVVLVLLAAWLALDGTALARLLSPLQRPLLAMLLPGLSVQGLAAASDGPQHDALVLRVRSVEYLVLDGRVVDPGLEVVATTPARQALRAAVLTALWAAWQVAGGAALRATGPLAVIGTAAVLLVPVLVLAGTVWALLESAGPLVQVSRLLLGGADLALVCGGIYLSATRR